MSAKSLLQKLKQLFGSADRSGSDSDSRPSRTTDVTVEREPEESSEIDAGGSTSKQTEPPAERGESVEKIKGIGPTYRDRLTASGIESIADLAASEPAIVADVAETSEGRASEWIKRAENW